MKKIPTKAIRNKIIKRLYLQNEANTLQTQIEEWFENHGGYKFEDYFCITGCCLYTEPSSACDYWLEMLDKFEEEQNGTKGTNN